MVRKAQLPVIGGVRKIVTIPGSNIPVGTTIAEFGSNTVTLAQLAAALDLLLPPNTGLIGGDTPTGSIALGPGLSGGGPILGSVPIRLTAPMALMPEDGADGDTGPPGKDGVIGRDGGAGAPGPPGIFGADGDDGQDGLPGFAGPPGGTGATGATGPPGISFFGTDGDDGQEGLPGLPGTPGKAGVAGAAGISGLPGFDGEDGMDGLPGIPGPPGSGVSVSYPGGVTTDLRFWFQADTANVSNGKHLPLLQNSTPLLPSYSPYANGRGALGTSTTLNSKPVLNLSGAAGMAYAFGGAASTALMALGDACTIFLVFQATSLASLSGIIGTPGSGGLEFDMAASGALSLVNSGIAILANSTTTVAVNTWFQGNMTYDGSTGNCAFRIGQAAAGSSSGLTHPLTGSNVIGAEQSGGTGSATGYLAELIIYERVLSSPEIASVESYLNSKWGV